MGISISTGTLTAGQSRTFNLSPASAVTLTMLPNARVTITETPTGVSGSGLGGNATRVHEPRLPGSFTYGPYPMGGAVVVENESNSGSSVAWVRSDALIAESVDGTASLVDGAGNRVLAISSYQPRVKALTWTGDGAASRTISGVGFEPDLIVFKPETAAPTLFWHRMCWRSNAPKMGEATAHVAAIVNFHADGVVVGTGANASGVVYHAICIADNGSGKLAVGSYAGNGVADRNIDVGLAPIYVAVKRDNTYPCWTRAEGQTTSYPLTAAASADNIKSLSATGFTLSSAADVNEASDAAGSGGEAYDYFALAASEVWRVTQFVGSGAARTLSMLDSPAFALIKSHDSGTPRDAQLVTSTMASGYSADINGAVEASVLSLSATGFSVGTSAVVNGSGITNTALVIAESRAAAQSVSRPALPAVRIGADGGMIAPTRNTDFALNGVAMSLEVAFVYRDTAPAQPITLLSVNENNTNGGHHFGLQLSTSNRSLQFQCTKTGPTSQTYEYGFVPKDGEVVHLGFSFDGTSEVLIAVNGRLLKRASSALTIAATATPANAKVTVGNRRSGSDVVSPSFDSTDCSFLLWRIYGAALTAEQWRARYRRAILRDFSQTDVSPLEEWDAANVVGSTLYANKKAANNMTLIACTTETT